MEGVLTHFGELRPRLKPASPRTDRSEQTVFPIHCSLCQDLGLANGFGWLMVLSQPLTGHVNLTNLFSKDQF